MITQLKLGGIVVEVVQKDIKNLHLSVYPPAGRVHISAPLRMNLDAIRVFAISKLAWIKQQQKKLREQERETPREYLDRESHYLWGKRYLLKVLEVAAVPNVELKHGKIILRVRPGSDAAARHVVMARLYRVQVKSMVLDLIAKWAPMIKVKVDHIFIQKMKTKWGSCNPASHAIRLNTDLALKPRECLEYIVVHEMVHLLAPTHNAQFVALMDRFMPQWRLRRDQLNRLPVRHEEWEY
jgi:predicted metal-dependent hydrolase